MAFSTRVLKLYGIFAILASVVTPSVFTQHYVQSNLVSSMSGVGTNPTNPVDPQLVNAWGLARSTTSFWWVADNGTGGSTLYDGTGTKQQNTVVTIPLPMGHAGPSKPTGVVFNGTSEFVLPNGMCA
jgi:hypothetical protein